MVHIDSSYFGSILIDGKKYDHDVIVDWKGNVQQRMKSHKFSKREFDDLLFLDPEVVVVGTGTSGMVSIDPQVEIEAKIKGIELIFKKTPEATKEFNKFVRRKRVVGVFHVTC